MHCKKCLHYDVCVKLGKPSLYGINQEIGCSAYKDKTKWEEKKEPENNADRLRAMNDEELADWLARTQIANVAEALAIARISYEQEYGMKDEVAKECLEWLKQPAE